MYMAWHPPSLLPGESALERCARLVRCARQVCAGAQKGVYATAARRERRGEIRETILNAYRVGGSQIRPVSP